MSRKVLILLVAWLLAASVAGAAWYLYSPSGAVVWALWAVLAVPAYLIASTAFEFVVHAYMALPGIKQATQYFERREAGKAFSPARTGWYLVATVLGCILLVAIVIVATHIYSATSEYLAQDHCLDRGGRWQSQQSSCEYEK
ncbi:MAG: hypothetical protein KF892_23455 [Rhizobacter sp.]|nr:hypothetical protein [Rhizobacter sp.]